MQMLAEANESIRQLTAALAAVLIDKHGGKCTVPVDRMDAAYGDPDGNITFLVRMDTLKPLRLHRLQVMESNGRTPYVQALPTSPDAMTSTVLDGSVLDASTPEPEPEPIECSDEWHKSGQGIRCSSCGRSNRIV